MLVTLDGPSGVGKSTLTPLLVAKLNLLSVTAVATTTPSRSVLGQLARNGTHEFRRHALACLVAADRYLHDVEVVRPALESGCVVVCDRYVASAFVFDRLDGVDREFTVGMYGAITRPRIAFMLSGDPEQSLVRAMHRGQYSRFHIQERAKAVEEARLYLEAAEYMERNAGYPVYRVSVAGHSADEVANELTSIVLQTRSEER